MGFNDFFFFEDSFNVFAHFTSAPSHTMLSVQQFLTKNSMNPVPHPPYSPDLALSNFLLFPWMKNIFTGKHFADVEEAKQKMMEVLKDIKINKFKYYFEQ